MKQIKILISAGEVSGDQRAAEVVAALKRQLDPSSSLSIYGMGGDRLAEQGVKLLVDATKSAGVMGFTDVLFKIKTLWRSFKILKQELYNNPPDLVLIVDFPDFNLRLAKAAKSLRIPVYYYIPPKVWAWRSKRVKTIKRYVDRVGAIFPFEVDFFKKRGMDRITYVGHPFINELKFDQLTLENLGLDSKLPSVLLLPGSRESEIKRHLEILVNSAKELVNKIPTLQPIFVAPNDLKAKKLESLIKTIDASFSVCCTSINAPQLMRITDIGILKSGTCNLEAAFCGLPFVCFYRTSPLSYWIAKNVIKIKEVSLVNICSTGTVKELIQDDFNVINVVKEAMILFEQRNIKKEQLKKVVECFNKDLPPHQGAADLVASQIYDLLL